MKEDLLDTQFEQQNALGSELPQIVGRLVQGRDTMSYETLDLYPSVKAWQISQRNIAGKGHGLEYHAWQIIDKKHRHTTASVQKGEIWTVLDAYVVEGNIRLLKIVGRGGESVGWTPHFYRLRMVDE